MVHESTWSLKRVFNYLKLNQLENIYLYIVGVIITGYVIDYKLVAIFFGSLKLIIPKRIIIKGNDMRQSLWMIYNIPRIDHTYERTVVLNGETITLCFTNYESVKNLPNPFSDWIENKIIKLGLWISSRDPFPVNCGFVVTKNKCSEDNQDYICKLISLSLSLVLPPPVHISHPGQYLDDGTIVNPSWGNIPTPNRVWNQCFDENDIDNIIGLLGRFNQKINIRYPHFDEVLKLASINNVLIETLGLWAFVEGFWNYSKGKSSLEKSFANLLTTDRFPNMGKRDPDVNRLKQSIKDQNLKLGANNFSELRNIIAHGSYVERENSWTTQQWEAIYAQRDLLLETILMALVEYNLRST
jgi:hypothetical protein